MCLTAYPVIAHWLCTSLYQVSSLFPPTLSFNEDHSYRNSVEFNYPWFHIWFLTQLQISMSMRQVPHRAWQHVAINGPFLAEVAHQEQIIYDNSLSLPKRHLPHWLEHTSFSVCIHVGWTRIVWKKQFCERTAHSTFFCVRKKDIFNY